MTFADRLKSLRETKGLTQQQLAEATGIPLGTLRDYEQGKRRHDPTLRVTIKLASALGTDCRAFAECVIEDPEPAARARSSKPAAEPKPAKRRKKGE